ncbi:hypothetical protein [Bifidobacterium polysaccharolyticum]|uniref:hypothetical protein n=1 Tax=Bifidobacterium polysaccharolyticum TaxID=2750967 RepID=UPI00061AA777
MDSQAISNQPTLVICEGSAESVIFELLLAEGKLIIPKDSLIEDPQTGRLYTRCRKDRDIEERFPFRYLWFFVREYRPYY